MTYPPQPPEPQYGLHEFLPPGPAPKKRRTWPLIALPVALLVAGAATYIAYDRGIILKDSGVKACEALRDGNKTFNGAAQNDKPLTEAQYRELRGVFADSRHDDIRDHGTKLMDVVWQVSQLGDEPGMEALAYIGPLTTHMTGLQSACADQGIIVNLKPAANASPDSADSDLEPCVEVFTDGKKIAEDFTGECALNNGSPWSILAMDCTDGRKLYQVDEVAGVEPGWGYAGGTYKADDTSRQSSKFFEALQDCTA